MADRNTTLVAVDVLADEYGRGKERVKKLKKAGYNPTVIQNEVNRLIAESKKKSIDTLAHEVIDGLWRSGLKREKALTVCGCNYDAIQNRVNEILDPHEKKPYPGKMPTLKIVKTNAEVIADALMFAKWITGDKRFGYGRMGGSKYEGTKEYSITHSGGCHFCGSNASKISKAKKAGLKNPEEWEYTYVCNTLVHACFAHAGVMSMLNAKGHSWWISSYQKSKYWEEIKKPSKYTSLKAGDVLFTDTHAMLYIGGGKIAEATSGGGDPASSKSAWEKSIRICDYTEKRYKSVTNVFRYVGTVNSTALIRYGEVSARVGLLQKYLIWYGALPAGADDCIFGDATRRAVEQLQKDQGLTVDGIVGNDTLTAMGKVVK